jgi:DNA-binding GntR family transcriptional regulator
MNLSQEVVLNVDGLFVERGVLRDGIVKALKSAIMSGQLKPGQRLNEKDLATYMKVSRAPLREAFLKLEHEGLVTKLPHHGAIVTEFSEFDVIEIYDLRIPLEGYAARIVIEQRLSVSATQQIRSAYDAMVDKAREGSLSVYLSADFAFHRTIWNATGNRRLVRILTELCTPFFGFSLIQGVGQGKSFSTEKAALEHLPVVEVLAGKDPELAEKVMRETITWNKTEYISRCWGASGAPRPPEDQA